MYPVINPVFLKACMCLIEAFVVEMIEAALVGVRIQWSMNRQSRGFGNPCKHHGWLMNDTISWPENDLYICFQKKTEKKREVVGFGELDGVKERIKGGKEIGVKNKFINATVNTCWNYQQNLLRTCRSWINLDNIIYIYIT